MASIPFNQVQVGQRLRFPNLDIVYTRVETIVAMDPDRDRTLQYFDKYGTRDAFCDSDSTTPVEVVEEAVTA